MMDAAASFFDKFADRGIIAGRLKQLYSAFAQGQHCNADLLIFDGFSVNVLEAKSVFPKSQCFVDAFSRDSQVVDLHIVRQAVSLAMRQTNSRWCYCNNSSTAEYGSIVLSAIFDDNSSSRSLVPFLFNRSNNNLSCS